MYRDSIWSLRLVLCVFAADDHHYRGLSSFGAPEDRSAPAPRDHAGFVRDAKANEAHAGPKHTAPYKLSGVKELSPLAALPLFDLVWDVMPDLMHIIPGIWKRHIFSMFTDRRKPKKPRPRSAWTRRQNDDLLRGHEEVLANLSEWVLSKQEQAVLDNRSRALGGVAGWIRSNIEVCTHAGSLTSHDWLVLVQGAGDYLLQGLFPADVQKRESMLALMSACNACLQCTSAFDSENREEVDKVKLQVIEALCDIELVLPRTELAIIFHILVHIPDCIYRWNSVRNYWSFFGERLCSILLDNVCLSLFSGFCLTFCTHSVYIL